MPTIIGEGKDKVILVTGGSGMVGHAIQWAVTDGGLGYPDEKWVFLSSQDGNLVKEVEVKAIYEKYRPTHVLHTAAMVGGLFKNLRYPADMFYRNILMNTFTIHYAHLYGAKKCVSMLSTCIFPDNIAYPMTEKDIHKGPPHPSNFAYAHAKRMVDIQNEAYRKQYGSKFTAIIPVNIYGQDDNFNIEDTHVIPGLMHKMYLAEKSKNPIEVWGSGKPLRQYVYGRDVARAMIWMMRNYEEREPIICVGDGCEVSIEDTVNMVARGMDFHGEIKFDTSRSDGQMRKTASNAKLKTVMPDFKFTPMDQAIKETADWFKANYDTCRK